MDPSIIQRTTEVFENQGLMRTFGAELARIAPGECTLRLPFSDGLTQHHGYFHGGVTATLADNAAGFASYTLMAENEQPLTVEFKISFLEAAQGEALEARGKVLRAGRRIKHAQSEVYALNEASETLVAIALVTIATAKSVPSGG